MGLTTPNLPDVDTASWSSLPRRQRLQVMTRHWVDNGFGTPSAIFVLYMLKIAMYVVAGAVLISLTPGLGGLTHIASWWTQPIVYEKVVVYNLLWEVLGLGCGSGPLTLRFWPPFGGFLYWLRPGTVRLAPWPDKVPLTRGFRRTGVDVALYAAVLAAGVLLILSDGDPEGFRLDTTWIAVLLGLLAILGLRDKVPFLAARPEIYGFILLISLFPAEELIPAWQFVFFFIWWGAAASKLNHHFPFVIQLMISNTPWNRSRKFKSQMYRDYPDDLRPSARAELGAH